MAMVVQTTNFQKLNELLADPSHKGVDQRKKIAEVAWGGKFMNVGVMGGFAVILVSSVVYFLAKPILCTLGIFFALQGLRYSYDAYQVFKNIEQLFSRSPPLLWAMAIVWDVEQCVYEILQGTSILTDPRSSCFTRMVRYLKQTDGLTPTNMIKSFFTPLPLAVPQPVG